MTPAEQQLIRDHLRHSGRIAGLVGALWVTSSAGGYVFGRLVLGPLVGHACYAYDRLRERTRR